MCGLCGYIGAADPSRSQRQRRANVLEALMLANEQRGTDASGVCTIKQDGTRTIYKNAVRSSILINEREFRSQIREQGNFIAIGHTRMATTGAAEKRRNAHPFTEGDVIGAHNGIIWNHEDIEKFIGRQGYKPMQVDSQAAFRLLAVFNSEPNEIKQVLPLLKGSLALTWQDARKPDTLYMFKHENPFSLVIVPSARTAFWSSDRNHLHPIIRASYGDNWYEFATHEDNLYEFTWEDDTLVYRKTRVDMPRIVYTNTGTDMSTMAWEREMQRQTGTPKDDGQDYSYFDSCEMCGREVDWANDHVEYYPSSGDEGYVLCGGCANWWETYGMGKFGDLTSAIVDRYTAPKQITTGADKAVDKVAAAITRAM